MNKKLPKFFLLTKNEETVMEVFWSKPSADGMSCSDIIKHIPEKTWNDKSIYAIIRKLEKKRAIELVPEKNSSKSYSRKYRAKLSANEFVLLNFNRFYRCEDKDRLILLSAFFRKVSIPKIEIYRVFKSFKIEETDDGV